MKFDFETIIKRKGSSKWAWMREKNASVSKGVIPFSVADMEFKLAPLLESELKKSIENSHLGYTRPTDEYFKSVIKWFKKRHDLELKKEWIVPTPGVVFALHTLITAFSKKGDEILITPPVYYPFFSAVKSTGRKLVESVLVNKNSRYEINFKDFAKKAKGAKIFILCSPHNPVGRVWSRDELTKIAEICYENGVLVISDEIHADLVMSGFKHTPFLSLNKKFRKNLITCTAPSKSFNIAGLQASNIIISDKNIRTTFKKELEKVGIEQLNTLAYDAVSIAYDECEEWLDQAILKIEENKALVENLIKDELPSIKVTPLEGTYLLWLDFRNLGLDYKELEKMLVFEAEIFGDNGYIFGRSGRGFERLNIACPTGELKKALNRLKESLKKRNLV